LSIALVSQHTKRMRLFDIIIHVLYGSIIFSTLSRNDTILGGKFIEYEMCILIFSKTFFQKNYLTWENAKRYVIILMCDVPCILVYDCSNYTHICTNYFFITYTRLHVSTLLGHHQDAIDYQRLQNKMCKNE
jgi:hypothetical protein